MEPEEHLLELLRFRNASLIRFAEVTQEFLREHSSIVSTPQSVELIERTLKKRASLIQAIQLGERRIQESAHLFIKSGQTLSPNGVKTIKAREDERIQLLELVERMSSSITHILDQAKQETLESLKSSRRLQGALSKYKSEWATKGQSGEGLDEIR